MNLLNIFQKKKSKVNVSIDKQILDFKSLGFKINEGVDIYKEIENWSNIENFEKRPYFLTYILLGSTTEDGKFTPITDNVWHFDMEAIEDHGAYVYILQNIKRISANSFDITDIEDYVDIEEGVAWVKFLLNGVEHKWDLRVDNDWTDPEIFVKITQLCREENIPGNLTFFNTGGQDIVLGWATDAEIRSIKKVTGLEIQRLA